MALVVVTLWWLSVNISLESSQNKQQFDSKIICTEERAEKKAITILLQFFFFV